MSRVTVPSRVLTTVAQVATYAGHSAYGPVYTDPVDVNVAVVQARQVVRTPRGDEATAESAVYAHPDDNTHLVPGSKVTIDGTVTIVLRSTHLPTPGRWVVSCRFGSFQVGSDDFGEGMLSCAPWAPTPLPRSAVGPPCR